MSYRTSNGDMVDQIAKAELGSETYTPEIFELNPHLALYGPLLPSGLLITLPHQAPVETVQPTIRLWGRA